MEGKVRVAPSEERAKNIKKGNREMRKIATTTTAATGEVS